MRNYLLAFLITCALFGLAFVAQAAPTSTFFRTLLPETTSTYDLGSASKMWNKLYTDGICIGVDCKTAWPSSTGNVATSSAETKGFLPYWTSTNGTPATLGSTATTTLTGTAPITFSQPISVIGSIASVITCATATGSIPGCLSAADFTTFNSKESPLTFTYPLTRSVNAISLAFGTTTNNTWSGLNIFNATTTLAGGLIAGDTTTGMFFDATSGRLSLGATDNTHIISGVTYGEKIAVHIEGATDGAGVSLHRHSDITGFGSHLLFSRSRGTEAAEGAVVNGDFLGRLDFIGHDGTDYEIGAQIDAIVDGVVGSNDLPTMLKFWTTPDGSATPLERLVIKNTGNIGIGTSTPGTLLSIGANGTGINFVDGTTATSTFSGHVRVKGNLQVDGKFFAPVTLVTSGDTTINGALTVTGATTLATTLTGVLKGASGLVSAMTGTTNYVARWTDANTLGTGVLYDNGTNVGVGETSPGTYGTLEVKSAAAASTIAPGNLGLVDSTAQAAGTGGMVVFGGKYTDAGAYTTAGWIRAAKTNGTTGNYGFDMTFGTRLDGSGSMTERMRITSAGNVGIGRSPSTRLDVEGTDTIPVYVRSSDTGSLIRFLTSSTVSRGAMGYDSTGAIFLNAALNATNMVILNGGNVGIGATSPLGQLHVATSSGVSSEILTLQQTGGWSGNHLNSIKWRDGSNVTGAIGARFDGSSVDFDFHSLYYGGYKTESDVVMTIKGTGNVGIGTTTPTGKLHIENGALRLSNAGSFTTAVNTQGIVLDTSASTAGIEFVTAVSGSGYGNRIVGADSGAGSSLLKIQGRTNSGTFSDIATFVSSGNVGIGTTSPYTTLAVSSSAGTLSVIGTGGATTPQFTIGSTNGAVFGANFTDTANRNFLSYTYDGTNGNSTTLQEPSAGSSFVSTQLLGLKFNTNGAERMRIDMSGNVGIGTTTPYTKLQVNAASQTLGSASPTGALLVTNTTGGAHGLELGSDATNLGYIQSRNINNQTYYQLLLNPSGGNVGIGTTNPGGKLQVGGDTAANTAAYIRSGGASNYAFLGVGRTSDSARVAVASAANEFLTGTVAGDAIFYGLSGAAWVGTDTAQPLVFTTNNTERMRILSGGNVGIGTTSPTAKLTVKDSGTGIVQVGQLSDATSYGGIGFTSASLSASNYVLASNAAAVLINAPSGGTLSFRINNADKMVVDTNGNVGIGTTTPGATLGVTGTSLFTGLATFMSNILVQASGYLNFGTVSGTSGYGIRDNAGTIEAKNSGGAWAALGGGGNTTSLSFASSTGTGSAVAAIQKFKVISVVAGDVVNWEVVFTDETACNAAGVNFNIQTVYKQSTYAATTTSFTNYGSGDSLFGCTVPAQYSFTATTTETVTVGALVGTGTFDVTGHTIHSTINVTKTH